MRMCAPTEMAFSRTERYQRFFGWNRRDAVFGMLFPIEFLTHHGTIRNLSAILACEARLFGTHVSLTAQIFERHQLLDGLVSASFGVLFIPIESLMRLGTVCSLFASTAHEFCTLRTRFSLTKKIGHRYLFSLSSEIKKFLYVILSE